MDKQQLLSEIKQMVIAGKLSRAEVNSVFQDPESSLESKHLNLSQVMYYIGAAIVFLGICVLISQNWEYLNTPTKILVTLGSGIAAYIVGALLMRYEEYKDIGLGFFLISALVFPVGLFVSADKIGLNTETSSVGLLIFLILFCLFLGSFFVYRKIIFTLFTVIFGTISFFFLVQWMVGDNFRSDDMAKIWEYRFLVTGLTYMLLGYYLRETAQKALTGTLYGFGSLIFLASAMALGGWEPNQNVFWELIYPLLVFGVVFLSVYVKSKSFLVFGSLGLIGYILKITSEYFSSGLGWPLALVLAGLAIMGVGYYAVKLNKKYFAQQV